MVSETPIQPILMGDAEKAVAVSEKLRSRGFWVQAIRAPTVRQGAARLRCVLNATHSVDQVIGLAEALAASLGESDE